MSVSSKGSNDRYDSIELGDSPVHPSGKKSKQPSSKKAPSAVAAAATSHGHDHEIDIHNTKVPEWVLDLLEYVFKIRKRKTTVEMEIYTGAIQFISCLYVLPVVPFQMKRVGYDEVSTCMATIITCALGCIVGGILTDMPLIIAPPTSVSIFFAVSMQQSHMTYLDGNAGLLISGAALAFSGIVPPVGRFFTRLIPDGIQAGISVGIGLITALAGAIEVNLVVRGKYTILDMGELTPEVVTAIANLIIVAVLLHYHVKGAFCTGLIIGTFMWWIISEEWPHSVVSAPTALASVGRTSNQHIVLLVFNMFFLYILTLNGLGRSLSDLAQLTKPNGAIPRGNLLFIVTGLMTMLSGYLSGPPILISPESAAGIKAGAKTGLSTLVCGILFGLSIFFAPIFSAVPAAGTAPLLIMVGVMMFGNAKRVDWADYKIAVPAYCVLFFIPFTYSILRGVAIGYIIYIMIGLFTGDLIQNFIDFFTNPLAILFPPKKPATPLATQEDDAHATASPDSAEDTEYAAVKEEQQKTFLGRAILQLQSVMDAQEMDAGTITRLEHM